MLSRSVPLSCDRASLYTALCRTNGPRIVLDSCWEPRRTKNRILSRLSICATDPFAILTARGNLATLRWKDGQSEQGSTLDLLRDLLKRFQLPGTDWPTPFPGGAMGYFGYELKSILEPVSSRLPGKSDLPDLWLGFFDSAVTVDLERELIHITATGLPQIGSRASLHAEAKVQELLSIVEGVQGKSDNRILLCPSDPKDPNSLKSNFTPASYARAVNQIKKSIAAGNIYQANLAHRFQTTYRGNPLQLFLKLRQHSPAPFSAFLDEKNFSVISMSPERFLHLDPNTRRIQTRPIKGTRPRGRTEAEDRTLARALITSEKDRAEHIMIVDLERNDLGRVAEVGTVHVSDCAILETFPTLFHLTSTVEATLAGNRDRVDLLKSTFPGGSITGAPKIRAMQMIDELETVRRGIYAGSLGYLSFTGGLDLNIAIRTIVTQANIASFHVGAGIVADSDPKCEYQETLIKGKALWEALQGLEPLKRECWKQSSSDLLADPIW